jgi:ribose transport system permease protein
MGLVWVLLLLGAVLTLLGGDVTVRQAVSTPDGHTAWVQVTRNTFLNPETLLTLLKETSFIGIMAMGVSLVIMAGGIDLSVGAIYALSAVGAGMLLRAWFLQSDISAPSIVVVATAVLISVGIGTACGAVNGLLTLGLRIHPFVVTLGTMAIFRGLAFVLTQGQAVTPVPEALRALVRWDAGSLLGRNTALYPVPTLIMLSTACVLAVFLWQTRYGRYVFALGGNYEGARLAGVPTGRVVLLTFTACGALTGLTAFLMLGYYGSASSDTGMGYELEVIAAAVVGGTVLTGGKGSVLGTLLGALLIKTIDQGIVILKIDQSYSRIIVGSVIILSVALDQYSTQWRRTTAAPKDVGA